MLRRCARGHLRDDAGLVLVMREVIVHLDAAGCCIVGEDLSSSVDGAVVRGNDEVYAL